MSNKPNFRKNRPQEHSVGMSQAMLDNMMATKPGQQVATMVAELSDWCSERDIDFDEVTKLFDKFAANSPLDLPQTVRAFVDMMKQRWSVYAGEQGETVKAARFLLPGDKDFHL